MADRQNPYRDDRFDDVKDGPISEQNRECRDCFCCLLFLINGIAMVVLAIYGYANGDTSDIYRATDNAQNICGQSNSAAKDFPLSYFYNPTTDNLDNRICVKSCPEYNNGVLSTVDCYLNGVVTSCAYTVTVSESGSYNIRNATTSDFIGYDSIEVIERVCIPTSATLENAFEPYSQSISRLLRQKSIANFITDLQENWPWLFLALGMAILFSIVLLCCFRCIAPCIVWFSIIAIFLLFIAMGIIFLINGGAISSSNTVGHLGVEVPDLPDDFEHYNIFGYVCFGLAAIFLILILCCCKQIRLAVALCGLAGKFVASVCQIVFVPVFMACVVIVLWVAALFAMVGLIGGATFVVNENDVFTEIASLTSDALVMFYYYVFATLWSNALLQAITIFVIAATCAMWYFTHGINQQLDSPVRKSYWWAFRYHFGSLAFGSFILALVEWIQFMVEVFSKQIEGCTDGNCCADCCMNCLRCCIQCVKRCVECISRNAYIQMAIRGKGFCASSYDAVAMILTNPARYTITTGLGEILMFITKLLVAGLTTFIFYLVITFVTNVKQNVQEPILLLVLVFIIGFTIAVIFMGVFSVSMETLLACFIFDEQGNSKMKYGPAELVDLMDT